MTADELLALVHDYGNAWHCAGDRERGKALRDRIRAEVARLHAEAEFWRLKFGEEPAAHDRDGQALYRVSRELAALRGKTAP